MRTSIHGLRTHLATTAALVACVAITPGASPRDSGTDVQAGRSERLYVATAALSTQAGHVLAIDPATGRVISQLDAGMRPEVLASKDGRRLYVVYDRLTSNGSAYVLQGVFLVLDAATWSVVARIDEPYGRGGQPTAYRSSMVLSQDGSWLFRTRRQYSTTTGSSEWIETFDTHTNVLLPETVATPLCGEGWLYPAAQRDTVYVVCPESHDLRIVTLNDSGGAANGGPRRIDLGPGSRQGYALPGFLTEADQTFTVIKTNGAFTRVAVNSGAVIQRDAVDRVGRRAAIPDERPAARPAADPPNAADWLAERVIGGLSAALSPDRAAIYVMTQGRGPRPVDLVVLDSRTLERVRVIPVSRPYVSFTLSGDGRRVYGIDRDNGAIVVIDSATGAELRVIPTAGRHPVFAVVAP